MSDEPTVPVEEPGQPEESRPAEKTDEVPQQKPVEKPLESDWQRRRRLAAVFGDVLPETTSDERDQGDGEVDRGAGGNDEWLRRQVPPHHG